MVTVTTNRGLFVPVFVFYLLSIQKQAESVKFYRCLYSTVFIVVNRTIVLSYVYLLLTTRLYKELPIQLVVSSVSAAHATSEYLSSH